MALIDTVRSGIDFANRFTKAQGFQAVVSYEAYQSNDGAGAVDREDPVDLNAIVNYKQQRVRSSSGELKQSVASITILDPGIVVDLLDKFTLPDGRTAPILNIEGPADGVTGLPMLTTVYLG